jgi:hypothetical protein
MDNFSGMFDRSKYYSQTEALKIFKISMARYKRCLLENNIPVVSHPVDLGGYLVDTKYVLKEDIEKLNLSKR